MKKVSKYRKYIVVILLGIVYIFIGPWIYTNLLVQSGKPIAKNLKLPIEASDLLSKVESIELLQSQNIYTLSGWIVQPIKSQGEIGDYSEQIVLYDEDINYSFGSEVYERSEIQSQYKSVNITLFPAGFSTEIFINTIKSKTYGLGILIHNSINDSSTFVKINQCLIRTPNFLKLVGLESPECRTVTHNSGEPTQIKEENIFVTENAKYNIEYLKSLDGKNNIFQLVGWGFILDEGDTNTNYEMSQLVLISENNEYYFSLMHKLRIDVQSYFQNLNLNLLDTGFESIISPVNIEPGNYQVGIIFSDSSTKNNMLIKTNRCLTNKDDVLLLVEDTYPSCFSDN
ncbi:MAG TPA: hypothetical protein PLQ69_00120 [Paludibacter sp.]|nr:hypothetical protein [Paludibacter sp.]HPM08909.1 hypothetical protein [Paludibacter sp.]